MKSLHSLQCSDLEVTKLVYIAGKTNMSKILKQRTFLLTKMLVSLLSGRFVILRVQYPMKITPNQQLQDDNSH